MMGRTHAISGAATWLSLCAGAAAAGWYPHRTVILVGAGVCAGFALAPDFDHPDSLISRTYGPVTRKVAHGVARLSRWVQWRTRTPRDYRARSGHRWLAHTWPFALVLGLIVALTGGLGGTWGVAAVMFVAATLAIRGLLPPRERYQWGPAGIAAVAALVGLSCGWLPHTSWWWTGLPAALGCLVHDLGDALTEQRCPLLWPIRISGRRWYPVGLPQVLRLTTGGRVEQKIVMPLLVVAAGLAGWAAVAGLT